MSMKVRRDRTPNVLGYKFDELCEFDHVKVELVPEKKGLILKHVEYEVTSRVSIVGEGCLLGSGVMSKVMNINMN